MVRGDSFDDLAEYIRRLTEDGHPADEVRQARCGFSGQEFRLMADPNEGCAQRVCVACGTAAFICDSEEIWEEAMDPPEAQYLQIGEIRLELQGSWSESDVQRDSEVQKVLRQEAARLGADTVISVMLVGKTGGHRPGSLVHEPRLVDHVVATAIRTRS